MCLLGCSPRRVGHPRVSTGTAIPDRKQGMNSLWALGGVASLGCGLRETSCSRDIRRRSGLLSLLSLLSLISAGHVSRGLWDKNGSSRAPRQAPSGLGATLTSVSSYLFWGWLPNPELSPRHRHVRSVPVITFVTQHTGHSLSPQIPRLGLEKAF